MSTTDLRKQRRPRIAALAVLLSFACARTAAPTHAPDPLAQPAAAEGVATTPEAPAPEPQVNAKINDPWRSDRIDPLVGRLESESREVWTQRERIIEAVAARPGMVVADIGAGSGFLTLMLAKAVGQGGKVHALDINRKLLARIDAQAKSAGLANVETMLTPEDGTPLAPNSVDLVFMCDAYHHFQSPRATMRSIRAALRPGGELVLVDLERIPGVTSADMLEHVRAGKEVFTREIEGDGFALVREHELAELQENYVLRFRKL